MTAVERIEHQNNAAGDRTDSPIAREAMLLMAVSDSRGGATQRTEPRSLTLTNPYAGIADSAVGSCGPTTDCESRRQFRPDPSLSTPRAREWQQQSQQQRRQNLEVGQDGRYEVKPGDSLWTIGERAARGDRSQRPSAREIQESMRRIIEANPDLKCNPNLLRRGQRLVIPDNVRPENGTPQAPEQPNSSHESRPAARPKPEVPPAQPAPEARPAQPAPEARPAQPAPEARPAQPAPEARPAQPAPEARPAQPAPEARPAQPAPEARPAQPTPEGRPAQPAPEAHPAQPVPETRPDSLPANPECPPHERSEKPRKPYDFNPFDGRFQNLPFFIPNADLEFLRKQSK